MRISKILLVFFVFFAVLKGEEKVPIKEPAEAGWEGIKRFATIDIYRHGKIEKYKVVEYMEDLGYIPDKRSVSVYFIKLEEVESPKRYKNYTILKAAFQNVSVGTVLYTLAKLSEKNVIFGKELWKTSTSRTTEVKVYSSSSSTSDKKKDEEEKRTEMTDSEQLRKNSELVETYIVPSYLLQPVNLLIEKPIGAFTLFNNILKEYNLIAIRLRGNLLKISVRESIEFKLNTDNEKVISDFIKRLKTYVSPAAHIVYDKELGKIIITDLKENIERIRNLTKDFYDLLERKTELYRRLEIEAQKSKNKIISRVFYFSNKRDLEIAKNIVKEYFRDKVSFSEDKDFNALIVVGKKYVIDKLSYRLNEISSKTVKSSIITSRVFYVRYITAEKLKKMIEPLLSENGDVYIVSTYEVSKKEEEDIKKDKIGIKGASELEENAFGDIDKEREVKFTARNAIIIRDYPERIEKIYRRFKKFLSEKPLKIIIRAKFVEVQKNVLRDLGFNWRVQFSKAFSPEFWSGSASVESSFGRTQGLLTFTLQRGRLNLLNLQLKAYERENLARSLAEPYVLTSNGEPAVVATGLEWPVFELSITQQLTQITWRYLKIPLTLIATPIVLPDDTIVLDITLTRKQIIDFFRYPLTEELTQDIPILSSSRIEIKVPIKNGETVVIGGILEKASSNSEEGVPGFRRIPLLGWFFKTQTKEIRDRELLIFLTPEIVEE